MFGLRGAPLRQLAGVQQMLLRVRRPEEGQQDPRRSGLHPGREWWLWCRAMPPNASKSSWHHFQASFVRVSLYLEMPRRAFFSYLLVPPFRIHVQLWWWSMVGYSDFKCLCSTSLPVTITRWGGELRTTEEAFLLPSQQPRVWILLEFISFLLSSWAVLRLNPMDFTNAVSGDI